MRENFIGFFKACALNNDLIRGLVVVFAITYVLTPFKWKDKREALFYLLKYVVWTALYFLVWATVHAAINTWWKEQEYLLFVTEIARVTLFYVIYALFFCKYSAKAKIILTSSLLAVVTNSDNLSNCFLSWVEDPALRPLFSVFYLVIVIFAVALKRFSVENVVDFPNGALFLILMTNGAIVLFTVLTALLTYWEERAVVYRVIIYSMQCFFVFPAYFSLLHVCKERDNLLEERLKNHMTEALQTQVLIAKDNLELVRKIRHDLKNQYTYMLALIRGGEYAKVEAMLEEMSSVPALTSGNMIDCGNFDISAILSMENSKAKTNGIELQCSVAVPKDLSLSNSDLCSVLSNLIDNAIEANVRYNVKDPIVVRVNCAQNFIYINVLNRLGDNADEKNVLLLKTSKENRGDHGLGTGIVKRIAENNGGSARFSVENGTFQAEVLLELRTIAQGGG